MYIWLNILVSSIVVLILTYIYPGVAVSGFFIAILVAAILGLVNSLIGPIVKFFNIPPDVLNLWLISMVVNIIVILLVEKFIPGFKLDGYPVAFIFSVILSLIGAGFSLEPGKKLFR